MFGYLMAIIGTSLEAEQMSAVHTTFYASREFPGMGARLQRASVEALRAKGVAEVILWAGLRGAGERISSLYRRIGANDHGRLYRLDLKEA